MNEWDEIAESWNRLRKRPLKEIYYFISILMKNGISGIVAGIGEGNGRNLLPFMKAGMEAINVDYSIRMLRNFNGLSCLANASMLPFRDSLFDAAISINALHCIVDRMQREVAFHEMWRILKPGGIAMVSAWNRWEKRFFPLNILTADVSVPWKISASEEGRIVKRRYHLFTKGELEKEMENAGFSIIDLFKGWDARESWFVIGKKRQ